MQSIAFPKQILRGERDPLAAVERETPGAFGLLLTQQHDSYVGATLRAQRKRSVRCRPYVPHIQAAASPRGGCTGRLQGSDAGGIESKLRGDAGQRYEEVN